MALTPGLDNWLKQAGYENYCFVSYPVTADVPEIKQCAIRVREDIRKGLGSSIPNPGVYLDEEGLRPGELWTEGLKRALCKSVAMVAVCAPIYFHPQHKWCGFEWAAMEMLSDLRLQNAGFRAIIPLMLKKTEPLPVAVSRIQQIDFAKVLLAGKRWYSTTEYKNKIELIVSRIEVIARTVAQRDSLPKCEQVQFPTESPFLDYQCMEDAPGALWE